MSGNYEPPGGPGGYQYPAPDDPNNGFNPYGTSLPYYLGSNSRNQQSNNPNSNQTPSLGFEPPQDQGQDTVMDGRSVATQASAPVSVPVSNFIDDGPQKPWESLEDYKVRVITATAGMQIEHRQAPIPPWISLQLVPTADMQTQFFQRMDREWDDHAAKINPASPMYDQSYHNQFMAENAARDARNTARRAEALSTRRRLDDVVGAQRTSSPEPPATTDALWTWGYQGPLTLTTAAPPGGQSTQPGNQSSGVPAGQGTQQGQNQGTGNASQTQQQPPVLGGGNAPVLASTGQGGPGGGGPSNFSRQPPQDGQNWSTARCNHCATLRRSCTIGTTGIPCKRCIDRQIQATCFWGLLITPARRPNPSGGVRGRVSGMVTAAPQNTNDDDDEEEEIADENTIVVDENTIVVDAPPRIVTNDQPDQPDRPAEDAVGRCEFCHSRKKGCDIDVVGRPCSYCRHHERTADQCVPGRKIKPRRTVYTAGSGARPLQDGTQRKGDRKRAPVTHYACNHCKSRKLRCDEGRPCSRCEKDGIHSTCSYERRNQQLTANPPNPSQTPGAINPTLVLRPPPTAAPTGPTTRDEPVAEAESQPVFDTEDSTVRNSSRDKPRATSVRPAAASQRLFDTEDLRRRRSGFRAGASQTTGQAPAEMPAKKPAKTPATKPADKVFSNPSAQLQDELANRPAVQQPTRAANRVEKRGTQRSRRAGPATELPRRASPPRRRRPSKRSPLQPPRGGGKTNWLAINEVDRNRLEKYQERLRTEARKRASSAQAPPQQPLPGDQINFMGETVSAQGTERLRGLFNSQTPQVREPTAFDNVMNPAPEAGRVSDLQPYNTASNQDDIPAHRGHNLRPRAPLRQNNNYNSQMMDSRTAEEDAMNTMATDGTLWPGADGQYSVQPGAFSTNHPDTVMGGTGYDPPDYDEPRASMFPPLRDQPVFIREDNNNLDNFFNLGAENRTILPPTVQPLADFVRPPRAPDGGPTRISVHAPNPEIPLPNDRSNWQENEVEYSNPGCHEWDQWYSYKLQQDRCDKKPTAACMVFNHVAFCTCHMCHYDQNEYHRNTEDDLIHRTKAFYCLACAATAKNLYTSSQGRDVRKAICMCTERLRKSWLCNGHRDQAVEKVRRALLLASDYTTRMLSGSAMPCGGCETALPSFLSGAWKCVTCREVVVA